MPLNVVDILHGCKLFSAIDARGFQRLVVLARLCKFRKGQAIFREGEECPGIYVVGKGTVRVFKTGPGGKEHVLHIVGPGNTFAEAAAIGGFQVPASAEALEPRRPVLFPREAIPRALAEDRAVVHGDDDGPVAVGRAPGGLDGRRGAARRGRADRPVPAAIARPTPTGRWPCPA